MGSVPEKPSESIRQTAHLPSSTATLVEELKRRLVCELYLRRGTFWKLVRACRMDWDLKPVIGLPPTTTGLVLLPENKPEHSYAAVSRSGVVNMHLSEEQRKRIEEHNQSVAEFERTWYRDLDRIVKSTVPSELGAYNIGDRSITCLPAGGRRLGSGYGFWLWFVSACVLYDPPETALLPFAECATPKPYRVSFGSLYRSQDDDKSVSMLAPPIKVQADSGELRDMIMAQVHLILDEINRHHLQALGLDVHAMWHDVVRKSDVVIEIYRQEELLKQRQYIEVHEHTTDEDVRAARRVIRAIQDRDRFRVLQAADPATRLKMLQEKQNSPQPRGKSVRDPLVAIQCAILYDRHNEKDPADGRRRTWTYERLAEEFGLKSARAATEYVIAGREILRKNKDTESPAHHFVSFLLQSNLLASM
jgi:hypothetical protein